MYKSPGYNQTNGKWSVAGVVHDATTGEVLVGATVSIVGTSQGTTTNSNGYFEIEFDKHYQELLIEYLGYQAFSSHINSETTEVSIHLQPGISLKTIYVIAYETKKELGIRACPWPISMGNNQELDKLAEWNVCFVVRR